MDPIRKIPKMFTKKFGNKVINRQYFRRKTGLKSTEPTPAKQEPKTNTDVEHLEKGTKSPNRNW